MMIYNMFLFSYFVSIVIHSVKIGINAIVTFYDMTEK